MAQVTLIDNVSPDGASPADGAARPRHPEKAHRPDTPMSVSYTHLTLPTILLV